MELLKKRRAGKEMVDRSSGEETSIPQVDEDEDDSFINEVREGAESDLDSFISEDDNLGAPSILDEIPFELTRHAHKTPKEHFKDVVEWMVHKKLNPAFSREDTLYQMAFFKMEDLVKGYAGSKFISSAWLGEFGKAIKARPVMIETERRTLPFDKGCEACNRSNHPTTFMIEFSGKPYNLDTLEAISDDEESDEDENGQYVDGERIERDSKGLIIPGAGRQYLVGRFCKENAVIAHSLLHWRWHLNDWVLDWLKSEGHTDPDKVLERENWTIKKRSKYANEVVDDMESSGQIRRLHRDFKSNLDEARNYKVSTDVSVILCWGLTNSS